MRENMALPANPLAQEIFCAGLDRLEAQEEITEVQRQVMWEWMEVLKRRITDLQIKSQEHPLEDEERAEMAAIAFYVGLWDARELDTS